MTKPSLDGLEEILVYKFNDRSLLERALAHSSCSIGSRVVNVQRPSSASYERLQFVGAAVLDMVIAKEMYILYTFCCPRDLTLLKVANVHSDKLARVAMKHHFHQYMLHKMSYFDTQIQEFSEEILAYPWNSHGLIDAPTFLAHVVQAIIGAIFIDSRTSLPPSSHSFENICKIIKALLSPMIYLETMEVHPRSELKELCQKYKFDLKYIDGSRQRESTKHVNVSVNGIVLGTGIHKSKKDIAQNRAAKVAVHNYKAAILEFGGSEVTKDEEIVNYMIEIDSPSSLHEVEEILGHKFSDRNLLEQAFIHRSYYNNSVSMRTRITSYQRLEFVGDAVLSMLMAEEMYLLYSELPHGQLTNLKAANVNNEKLARVAINYGFHNYLGSKGPHLDEQVQDFSVELSEYPAVHSNGLVDAPKSLADLVEAIIGAVFIDSNFCLDTVWKIITNLLTPMTSLETLTEHPNAELHKLCQKNNLKIHIMEDSGDHWRKARRCDILVNGKLMGTGIHGAKKEIALNRAAKAAFENLKTMIAATKVRSGESA